jgi:hypothetical protein
VTGIVKETAMQVSLYVMGTVKETAITVISLM